jgi:anti-sigma factor RsiW
LSHAPLEAISAFYDGELPPGEAARVEAHMRECTECARELAMIRALGEAMRDSLSQPVERSVWQRVHLSITRPIGWLLVVAGVAVWVTLAIVEWFRVGELTPLWLSTTAVAIGLALLVVGIGYEQYRDWKREPYKDVQ